MTTGPDPGVPENDKPIKIRSPFSWPDAIAMSVLVVCATIIIVVLLVR